MSDKTLADVLADNMAPEYIDGYGVMLAFSGDAEDLADIITAAGFGYREPGAKS